MLRELVEWESYYVIVGAAAGALIGLQFVVMTLIAENPPARVAEAGAAFATPTIVHFSSALLLAAVLRVPWHTIAPFALVWGLIGLYGFGYSFVVARRMRRQDVYGPDWEDWLFHLVLPMVTYALLALSALAVTSHERGALFAVGGATLALLFIGIHNSWDAIAYHVFITMRKKKTGSEL